MNHLNYPVILASNSPRRQKLLGELGIEFKILVREIDEDFPSDMRPDHVAPYLAALKSTAYEQEIDQGFLIITADTTVVLRDVVINKPADRADAIRMLTELSGNKHTVVTGVHLNCKSKAKTFSVKTDVFFKELKPEEIEYYVDTYSPYDKAGAYGIQEWLGYIGIERIDGCFFNVMGLPLSRLYAELQAF